MNNNFNYKNSMLMILFISMLFPTMLMAQDGVNAASMIMSTQNTSVSIIKFITNLAFVTGVILAGFALWEIRKLGTRDGSGSPKKIFWMFIIGTLLVNYGGTVSIFTNTLALGNPETNILASAPSGNADATASMTALMASVLLIIQVIGNITFFRGVWSLKQWSSGNGQGGEIWKPTALIILGSFAINIHKTIALFAGTTGVALPSWLS